MFAARVLRKIQMRRTLRAALRIAAFGLRLSEVVVGSIFLFVTRETQLDATDAVMEDSSM
eukprot:3389480-Amphidinium_carterae.1